MIKNFHFCALAIILQHISFEHINFWVKYFVVHPDLKLLNRYCHCVTWLNLSCYLIRKVHSWFAFSLSILIRLYYSLTSYSRQWHTLHFCFNAIIAWYRFSGFKGKMINFLGTSKRQVIQIFTFHCNSGQGFQLCFNIFNNLQDSTLSGWQVRSLKFKFWFSLHIPKGFLY